MRFPSPHLAGAPRVPGSLAGIVFVVAVLAACQGRLPVPPPPPPPPPGEANITLGVVTVDGRVAPAATFPVSVVVTNLGAALAAGALELRAQDPFTGTLALADDLAVDAEGSVAGDITAPARTGTFTVSLVGFINGAASGDTVTVDVVLTCDDGVFCNGTERFAGGACVPGFEPCDDGAACTADSCDEPTMLCSHVVGQDDCATCSASCLPDCTDRVCGSDGCGGTCGACTTAGEGCATALGTCVPADQPGTCASPLPLFAGGADASPGRLVVDGDSGAGTAVSIPSCNATSTSVESVYSFTVPVGGQLGIDARSSGFDTVLHLRTSCLSDAAADTVACADDSSPPGDFGSRVSALLDAGTYFLIVDGFDDTQFGPFTLEVNFVAACAPQCDGRSCGGDDGCGGDCGGCDTDFTCDAATFRCTADVCTPDCDGKQCGNDGCGSSCGDCAPPALCVDATQSCEEFTVCDHDAPVCVSGCAATEFCGTDCLCHGVDEPLPDLVLNVQRLADEILLDSIDVDAASCSVVENCVGGTGTRALLRFSVEAINQGQATMVVDPPDTRPDQFTFSSCHGHYHFFGFARYFLQDASGAVVLEGAKQAYCMEDTVQVHAGPNVGCEKLYSCDEQGIQPGWSDLYGNALDCQWLDITAVPAGDYTLAVSLNPGRGFEEISFDNNSGSVPVTIP